jgi:beta-RFAP synthase
LHFGLLRFAPTGGLSFGGIGMMVDKPRVVVVVFPANQWSSRGPASQRALAWARHAMIMFQPTSVRALRIEVRASPLPHTGLGTGTQLALAIATAVRAVCDLPDLAPVELASAMGRGQRSAIGSYGFYYGGLILETGQDAAGNLGKLQQRVAIPSDWQIVLITPPAEQGCHGCLEADAFGQLGTIPQATTNRLLELATSQIIPAAERNDPATFDQAVFQYGLLAGKCFTPVQGGPFASDAITRRVEVLRHLGIHGVGQSSWGPTLFALVRDDSPDALIAELAAMPEFTGCDFLVTSPDNRGAVLTIDGNIAE